jgi:hypothetical protein
MHAQRLASWWLVLQHSVAPGNGGVVSTHHACAQLVQFCLFVRVAGLRIPHGV